MLQRPLELSAKAWHPWHPAGASRDGENAAGMSCIRSRFKTDMANALLELSEEEWLACENPNDLLRRFRDHASERKIRLLVCHCYRRAWRCMPQPFAVRKTFIKCVERFIEGDISPDRFATACRDVERADEETRVLPRGWHAWSLRNPEVSKIEIPLSEARLLLADLASSHERAARGNDDSFETQAAAHSAFSRADREERRLQCDLLRDILGPRPFRQVTIEPAWLAWNDSTIPKMAQATYAERSFDRMPILADALEDAGCSNEDILSHCRGPGPHVRGCHVIDAILGKE